MLLFHGLGALSALNPAVRASANLPGAANAGVYVEPKGPVGWNRFGLDRKMRDERAQATARARAFSDKLLATYADKIPDATAIEGKVGGAQACRQARLTPDNPSSTRILYPLGVLEVLGVPFTADHWKDDPTKTLERTYAPTPNQQWLADVQIYTTSQRALAKAVGKELASEWDLPNLWLDLAQPAVPGKTAPRGIQRVIDQKLAGYSVDGLLKGGRWTISHPGYSLNPIPPTPEERTGKGGLRAYYARGGYVLELDALNGKRRLQARRLNLPVGYMRCTTTQNAKGDIVPEPAPFVTPEVYSNIGHYGEGWDVFVTVGPEYKLRVEARDPDWWTEGRGWVLSKIASIPGQVCKRQELIQTATSLYPPTGPEKVAVDMGRSYLAKTCAGQAPTPKDQQSFVPPPPEPPGKEPPPHVEDVPVGLSPLQLGGLAVAGVLAGVLIAKRRA
jgi:hypothetical protein